MAVASIATNLSPTWTEEGAELCRWTKGDRRMGQLAVHLKLDRECNEWSLATNDPVSHEQGQSHMNEED